MVTLSLVAQLVFANDEIYWAGLVSYFLQLLMLVFAFAIVSKEPNKKNKVIFVNFVILFAAQIPSFVSRFVQNANLKFLAEQYIIFGLGYFVLAFSITYLTFDVLFRDYTTLQKYALALVVVGGFFSYYYAPMLVDQKYAYKTPDVLDWKVMYKFDSTYAASHDGATPTVDEIAQGVQLKSWKDGIAVGELYPEANRNRVEELYPYLEGSNYILLVFKPIFKSAIKMCVVSIGFILLFFGYVYMKDPPQGAYIEKIMFLFLVYCTLEILHMWSTIHSLEWGSAMAFWSVGAYVSDLVLLLMTGVFAMRLKFISSIRGEFYESELAANPGGVTRWRDGLDNVVIEGFFNRKAILGRLFVSARRPS